ncbi:MAG: 2,3-diphosphoglycerate-dependent phosphoglycerate mutase [Candidatus Binatia bacterium]
MDARSAATANRSAPRGAAVAPPGVLTLLRHGESEWNHQGRFSGWADVGLSENGRAQAERAGRLLARNGLPIDLCLTSMLGRATATSQIVLQVLGRDNVSVEESWRLNERHYGALQGLRTWTAVRRYGPLAVLRCRRQFRRRPPLLAAGDPRCPGRDPRYACIAPAALPRGESLADTLDRVLPYWEKRIVPELACGRHVLVVSHKNTLRALLVLLRRMAPLQVPGFRITNGVPFVMAFEDGDRWLFGRHLAADDGSFRDGTPA